MIFSMKIRNLCTPFTISTLFSATVKNNSNETFPSTLKLCRNFGHLYKVSVYTSFLKSISSVQNVQFLK